MYALTNATIHKMHSLITVMFNVVKMPPAMNRLNLLTLPTQPEAVHQPVVWVSSSYSWLLPSQLLGPERFS